MYKNYFALYCAPFQVFQCCDGSLVLEKANNLYTICQITLQAVGNILVSALDISKKVEESMIDILHPDEDEPILDDNERKCNPITIVSCGSAAHCANWLPRCYCQVFEQITVSQQISRHTFLDG